MTGLQTLSFHQLFYFSEWAFKYVAVTFDQELPWIDPKALKLAVHQLAERHEILRAVFVRDGDEIKQQILPSEDFSIEITEHGEVVSDNEMLRIVYDAKTMIFDLDTSPWVQAKIFRLESGNYRLLFTMHHAIADSYCMGIIRDELTRMYTAMLEKKKVKLEPLPFQYRDFAVWQREFVNSHDGVRHKLYWQDRLKGFQPAMEFPLSGRHGDKSHRNTCIYISSVIEGDLYEDIRGRLKKNGLTRANLLMGVLYLLLNQLTGREDITLFVPFSGRDSPYYDGLDIRKAIGCFVSALFIRSHVTRNTPAIDFLQHLQDNFMDDLNFASYPFGKLLYELPEMTDAVDLESVVYYNYHNYDFLKESAYEAGVLEKEGKKISVLPGQCVMGLVVMEFSNCLSLAHRFRMDTFDETKALEIKEQYFSILKEVINIL